MGAFESANINDTAIKSMSTIADSVCGKEPEAYKGGDILRHSLKRLADHMKGGKFSKSASMEKQDASTAATVSDLKDDFNALLIKLKNAGLMAGEDFTLAFATVTDSIEGRADRQFNTGKVSSVTESDGVITITLASGTKVSDLKDFDALNGWGVHKWLGIGIGAGVNPITGLRYNGHDITSDDVTEATQCGLSAGYFVRWVAADLVLAGDNTQKSKGYFTLASDGYSEKTYTLKIVEG